jgi:hypothetical protein
MTASSKSFTIHHSCPSSHHIWKEQDSAVGWRMSLNTVTCWVYNERNNFTPIGYSEFNPHSLLHLHNSQFQLLPLAVSQLLLLLPFTPANARLQLTSYSGYWRIFLLCSFRTDNTENSYVIATTVA